MSATVPAPDGDLLTVTREVEEFVAGDGWDQQPQLFALVPTADLLEKQPDLADQVDQNAALVPIAQDALPDTDLADTLAGIMWPEVVIGCALAHEILVLPPEAEASLPSGPDAADDAVRQAAAEHPQRREARLVAAVLRDGSRACLLRLRGQEDDELVVDPDLAPNLTRALLATLDN